MDASGIKRPVLAGWSYGGRIMADYLRIHGPDKLAGLNYVDAGQKADPAFVGPNLKNLPLMASEDLAVNIAATRAFLRDCGVKAMTDEQLEEAFAVLQGMVDQRLGEKAKVIEGVNEPVPALPLPPKTNS